jgi:hypothetical protein
MMAFIAIKNVLEYYDGPQVFEAVDLAGASYICLAGPYGSSFDCAAIRIEPHRLHSFVAGSCDLLSLIVDRDASLDWFECKYDGERIRVLRNRGSDQIPDDLLPEEGFYHEQKSIAAEVIEVAEERGSCVVAVSLWDGGSGDAHSVRASALGAILVDFQHVFNKAFSNWQRSNRKTEGNAIAPSLNAFASVTGSYKIYLEAESGVGLFGSSNAVNALQILDKVFEDPSDVRRTVESLAEHKGHFAGALHSMLKTMVQNKTSLSYSYADNSTRILRGSSISLAEAVAIANALAEREELESESIQITGVLEKLDAKSGAWRLLAENRSYTGKADRKSLKLTGLTIGESYTFGCEERAELLGDGSEKTTLLLKEIS